MIHKVSKFSFIMPQFSLIKPRCMRPTPIGVVENLLVGVRFRFLAKKRDDDDNVYDDPYLGPVIQKLETIRTLVPHHRCPINETT